MTNFVKLEVGMLVQLYNYYCGFDEYTRQAPHIVGMYLGTGREAQFEYYEIAVLIDNERPGNKGGFVQRYLTSDFYISPLKKKARKGTNIKLIKPGED